MKKYFIALMALGFVTLSCNSQPKDSDQSKNTTETEIADYHGKTIPLDKQKFLDQIMNYEENPTEWQYKGDKPGIIDFYADWCRPCKITSPILEELAQEYAGKINIYKVDIQKERELAAVFGVQSIPTFLFIPVEGTPSLSSGIARTPEATKQMFIDQIELLLNQ